MKISFEITLINMLTVIIMYCNCVVHGRARRALIRHALVLSASPVTYVCEAGATLWDGQYF